MILLQKGRYRARLAASKADLAMALALRARVFAADGPEPDDFDARCDHVLVEDRGSGAAVAVFRLLRLADGGGIEQSYAAQFYGLGRLARFGAPMMEVGRFCVAPGHGDADILRLAWGAIAVLVDRHGIALLFGCASFPGTDPAAHAEAFAWLRAHHLAPHRWRPAPKAARIVDLAALPAAPPDRRAALAAMPPLLRTYLGMGGWVSDHAVIDAPMGTMHVFTGVEIAAIPPARARLLRQVAGVAPRHLEEQR